MSPNAKYYAFLIVDDFSRFIQVLFLTSKDDAFKIFCKRVQIEKGYIIFYIRSDHGRQFENYAFKNFVITLISNINFHHLKLHSKMGC